jgi:hypothetical protein
MAGSAADGDPVAGQRTVTVSFTEVAGDDPLEADDRTQALYALREVALDGESFVRDRGMSRTDGYWRKA